MRIYHACNADNDDDDDDDGNHLNSACSTGVSSRGMLPFCVTTNHCTWNHNVIMMMRTRVVLMMMMMTRPEVWVWPELEPRL